MSEQIFADEQEEVKVDDQQEKKPRRRRRRRQQQEEQQQQQERSQFSEQAGEAFANLADQIASHLPKKFFEPAPLTQDERVGIKESVTVLASSMEDEKLQKFAKSMPWIVLGSVSLIVLLSRMRRRERSDHNLWQSGIGQDDSREKIGEKVVTQEGQQANIGL